MFDNLPKLGQRIKVKNYYGFDPNGLIPTGATGTVVSLHLENGAMQPTIEVRMDAPNGMKAGEEPYGLEYGVMSFYPSCGQQYPNEHGSKPFVDTVAWFNYHCECLT